MASLLFAAPANATAVTYDLNSVTKGSGSGIVYSLIDSNAPGQLQLSAAKNKTEYATWTAIKGGDFSFDWSISGTAAPGSTAYFLINGVATILGQGAILGTVSGSSLFNLASGDVFGFRLVGTTQNKSNTSNLQISNFVPSAPEIDGGMMPLALLLVGLGFIAARRSETIRGGHAA